MLISSRYQFRNRAGKNRSNDQSESDRARQRSTWRLIREFFALLKGDAFSLFVAISTLTVATMLALVPPAMTKFLVDQVLTGRPLPDWMRSIMPTDRWHLLCVLTGMVLVIAVVRPALHLWGRWHATLTSKRLMARTSQRLFQHVIRLPLHRVQEMKSGGTTSVLRLDATSVSDLVFGMIYNPWRALVQLIGSLIILAFIDGILLLAAIVFIPVVFYSHRTWIREIRPRYREVKKQRELIDAYTTEVFAGMRVVRGFNRERRECLRFLRQNHLMIRQQLDVWWASRSIEVMWEIFMPLSAAGLMLYGGSQILGGQLTPGDLAMFLVYLMMLLVPLSMMAQSAVQLQSGLAGLDRILDILEEPNESQAAGSGKRPPIKAEIQGELEMQQVSFSYPGTEQPAVNAITLRIPAGSTVALVGPSGAGKTTICQLLARFYNPGQGRILLDGTDVTEFGMEGYRSLFGIVEQDVFLFDGTVRENMAYAAHDPTDEQLREAARMANADEFISALPDGYETRIGERGVNLSGGQRQRLALARAILADPRFLILDEATSNLDSLSERMIQRSLQSLMNNRTCIVIAHRLSTIRAADSIVVIDRGEILETGSHEELQKWGQHYREMLRVQLQIPDAAVDLEQSGTRSG